MTVLISFFLTFLFAEILLNVLAKFNYLPYQNISNKSYNRSRGKAGDIVKGYEINSEGFYDDEFKGEENTKKIVVIGDSYTFGVVPLKYNYLKILEDKLDPKEVEVVNMGIPGNNLVDYYELLKDEGLKYLPDTILICFFSGNDYIIPPESKFKPDDKAFKVNVDVHQKYTTNIIATNKLEAEFIAKKRLELGHLRKKDEVIKMSYSNVNEEKLHLFKFYDYLINYNSVKVNFDKYDDKEASLSKEKFIEIESRRVKKYRNRDTKIKHQINFVIDYFQKINSIGDSIDSKVIFVIQPEELQISKKHQKNITNLELFKNDTFDFYRTNRMLTQKLDSLNLTYIDLLEPFVERGKTTNLYKPRDTHWNIEGNKLAGEILYEQLK